jgi:hypothetical protein
VVREETPSVPGFAISSLYGAAREVGGGLFQVIPGNSGDVLILLADLSGKGLKAAMMTPKPMSALQALSIGFLVQITLPGCFKLRGASSSGSAAKHVQAMEQDHSGGVIGKLIMCLATGFPLEQRPRLYDVHNARHGGQECPTASTTSQGRLSW